MAELTPAEKHQLKVAQDTLKMNDVFVRMMGDMSKEEAKKIVKRLTEKSKK